MAVQASLPAGLPALPAPLSGVLANSALTDLATADSPSSLGQFQTQWGVFDQSGAAVVAAESTVAFEYKQDYVVADFPVEKGGFESYDKVQTPYDVRVRMACGGSVQNRTAFLQSIDQIIRALDLYDVNTPEGPYQNLNFTHRGFTRTNENGATLLIVDLWAVEIRQTAESTFSSNTTLTPVGGPENISVTGTPSSALSGPSTEDVRVTSSPSPSAISQINMGAVQPSSVPPQFVQQWTGVQAQGGGW